MDTGTSSLAGGLALNSAVATPGINNFNPAIENIPGYSSIRTYSLKNGVSKQEENKGILLASSRFSTAARPSLLNPAGTIAIGMDDPDDKEFFLMCLDPEILRHRALDNPLVAYTRFSEHMSSTRWLNHSYLLCATGKGNLNIFKFDRPANTLTQVWSGKDISGSFIRETGLNPKNPTVIAIGGFDQKLNIMDLNQLSTPYLQRLDLQSTIGSVKWSDNHNGNLVSCTLDEGKIFLFDVRSTIKEPAYYHDAKKDDLYTHECYNDYQILLGFGDGKIHQVDSRYGKQPLQTWKDPYVEAIGNMEYNPDSGRLVVSGYGDYTVWDIVNGEALVHSHSHSGDQSLQGRGWNCAAVFSDQDEILTTDSSGTAALIQLGEKRTAQ